MMAAGFEAFAKTHDGENMSGAGLFARFGLNVELGEGRPQSREGGDALMQADRAAQTIVELSGMSQDAA